MSEALRTCPILELNSKQLQEFEYTPSEEVTKSLEGFGYGPSKRLVDTFYLGPDMLTAVGVLKVTKKHCKDHFGLVRGVDFLEMMAQVYVLYHYKIGTADVGRPLFAGVDDAHFWKIATPGAILNLVVQRTESVNKNQYTGYGWALRSRTVLAEAIISGGVMEGNIDGLKKRADTLQKRESPIFRLQPTTK